MAERRVAIVHDWFQGYHGAERTVEAIRTGVFPDFPPDVLTFFAARELLPTGLASSIVAESRIARLPGLRQRGHDPGRWRYLLPYMPTYFRNLDVDAYDVVVSSSHACAVHVRPRKDAFHLCYCYTPMRYAWLPELDAGRTSGVRGLALGAVRKQLRRADLEASKRPNAYVAISTAVRERIRRFYGRDAEVIHPPVDVDQFSAREDKAAGHFLWVGRLVPYKRPDLVAEAFRGLPYRLTMVGIGPMESRLRAGLPPNVELRSWLNRDELVRLFERASGFLHLGEEDFGISMVEALAAGTPVVALDAGGARDIVEHGVHGLLIDQVDLDSIRSAVRSLEATKWKASELAAHAARFSADEFATRFRAAVDSFSAGTGLQRS